MSKSKLHTPQTKEKSSQPRAQSLSQKRRNRKKKSHNLQSGDPPVTTLLDSELLPIELYSDFESCLKQADNGHSVCSKCRIVKINISTMANDSAESRDQVKAAREAKKLAKQLAKKKGAGSEIKESAKGTGDKENSIKDVLSKVSQESSEQSKVIKSNDEVDRALPIVPTNIGGQSVEKIEVDKEQIKTERASRKSAKQAKKKDISSTQTPVELAPTKADTEMTVRDVIETLRDIKIVAQEVKDITAHVQALNLDKQKPEKKSSAPKEQIKEKDKTKESGKDTVTESNEGGKSKAELKAERRAKQEAQRAAKEAATQAKAVVKPKEQNTQPSKEPIKAVLKEKSPKPKTASKQSAKQQGHRVNWFRHLYNEDDKAKLNSIPINSNLHPAVVKLGVQLATRVVTGSNARCIALLDALKKMVRDYSLPAKTEFGRGLEAHLATSLEFLWSMRQPSASQTNAVKFFRHHLTQLPNNVDEFDAKKTLQEEIDRYIHEQIDMAGEAISIAVRKKICDGDNILTYGCSSLIERILVEAHQAGVVFRAVVVGGGGEAGRAARETTRRLCARGVSVVCADITTASLVMRTVDKVVVGASALLADGAVVARAGTAGVALAARARNVPVLVACETHKFCDRVQTDAFLYNEIGDPDELIDKSDDSSPLKDWRSNPNLTPLNLTYDVTPPNLVTAVVTELAILPCTSAPVVLRFKLSEYSV